MTAQDVLLYSEIFFVISVGIALSAVLWRGFFIMGRVQKILNYVEHVQSLFVAFEEFPLNLIRKISKFF